MDPVDLHSDGRIAAVAKTDQAALLASLARQVALADGYTLRSFFKMLAMYDTLMHLNAFFPDLVDQYRSAAPADCRVGGIDELVLERTVEMVGFPGAPRLEIYRSFNGWREGKTVPIKDYQMGMLLDTTVRLGKLKHVVFGDQVDIFEFETVFTLFEFVEGIGWELGFHGTPRECQLRR